MSMKMFKPVPRKAAPLPVSEFVTKTATGLMMVTAAFLVLFRLGTASAPTADAAIKIFLN